MNTEQTTMMMCRLLAVPKLCLSSSREMLSKKNCSVDPDIAIATAIAIEKVIARYAAAANHSAAFRGTIG